jgi:hypothetical protein
MLVAFFVTKAISGLAMAADCLLICSQYGLRALLSLLTSAKVILTLCFEWQSKLLAAPACGVYAPQESAVVIIGGEAGKPEFIVGIVPMPYAACYCVRAGLGQSISLSLSEHGYTVFLLCPNVPVTCTASGQATKSSAVSSVRVLLPFASL